MLQFELTVKNPIDCLYEQLCVNLEVLDKNSNLYKLIYEGLENTQAK
jgi:hypothetical protein